MQRLSAEGQKEFDADAQSCHQGRRRMPAGRGKRNSTQRDATRRDETRRDATREATQAPSTFPRPLASRRVCRVPLGHRRPLFFRVALASRTHCATYYPRCALLLCMLYYVVIIHVVVTHKYLVRHLLMSWRSMPTACEHWRL